MVDLYTRNSELLIIISVLLPIVLSVMHYIIFGSKGIRLGSDANAIQRFSMSERIFHFIRMLSFIVVAGTGVYFIVQGGSKTSGIVHSTNGSIFLLMSIFTLVMWFKSCLFTGYDGLWVKNLGGYLSKEETSLPADKFNAGQKVFFWLGIIFALILAITGFILMRSMIAQTDVNGTILVIHGISAAVLITAVIGHIYLSLWVNKGAWRVLTSGKVSSEWAECHHPCWKPTALEKQA